MKLKRINLKRATKSPQGGGYGEHPDINLKKCYLAKWDGHFVAGHFSRQWFGLHFCGFWATGFQFDKPGTNHSPWQALWEIIEK